MIDVDRARDFMRGAARLLERRLYETQFEGASAEGVVAAVAAYRNDDGGLGHGIDPDVRASPSQPVAVAFGLRALAALEAAPRTLLDGCCDFLASVADERGAVPALLPSFLEYPRAEHWGTEPPPELFHTVGIAASLHELGHRHEWLDRATAFCLADLEREPPHEAHRIRQALRFVDVLGRDGLFERLSEAIEGAEYYRVDPGSPEYGVSPLQLAATRDRARRLFPDDLLETHLDALEAEQQLDGGWPIRWDPGSEGSRLEWRGYLTLEALNLLRDHGRLD